MVTFNDAELTAFRYRRPILQQERLNFQCELSGYLEIHLELIKEQQTLKRNNKQVHHLTDHVYNIASMWNTVKQKLWRENLNNFMKRIGSIAIVFI